MTDSEPILVRIQRRGRGGCVVFFFKIRPPVKLVAAARRGYLKSHPRLLLIAGYACLNGLIFGAAPVCAAPFGSLSTRKGGNEDRLIVAPTITTEYNTNALSFNRDSSSPSDNLRTTLGVDLSVNRQFGQTRIRASGSFGYDFNSRFTFLNQPRLRFSGSASLPTGAPCGVVLSGSYRQFQLDQADLIGRVKARSEEAIYGARLACNKLNGFAPVLGISQQTLNSSRFKFLSSVSTTYTGGISYTQPSLGVISVSADYTRLTRPTVQDNLGIDDSTVVKSISLGLSRSVAPRLKYALRAGYSEASPNRAAVRSYKGVTFDGNVNYFFTPYFSLNASAGRALTNENGFSSTYVKRDIYMVSLERQITSRSNVAVSGRYVERSFRGENFIPAFDPISKDRNYQLAVNYSLNLGSAMRLTTGYSHVWRHSPNVIYDYRADIFKVSLGAQF